MSTVSSLCSDQVAPVLFSFSMSDLKDLQNKISEAQKNQQESEIETSNSAEGLNIGMRLLTEIIGTLGVSGVIGYFIDQWLNTSPAFLLTFIVLGIITLFYNLLKFLNGYGQNVGFTDLPNEKKTATPTANKTEEDT